MNPPIEETLRKAREVLERCGKSGSNADPVPFELEKILITLPRPWDAFSGAFMDTIRGMGGDEAIRGVVIEALEEVRDAARRAPAQIDVTLRHVTERLELFASVPTVAQDAANTPLEFSFDDIDPAMFEAFMAEARDFLDGIESSVIDLVKSGSTDALNQLFRTMHTLKGSSGMIGLMKMKSVAHAAEDVMDGVKRGKVVVAATETPLLAAVDFMATILSRLEAREGLDDLDESTLVADLRALVTTGGNAAGLPAPDGDRPGVKTPKPAPAVATSTTTGVKSGAVRIDVKKLDEIFDRMSEMVIGRIRLEGRIDMLNAAITAKSGARGSGKFTTHGLGATAGETPADSWRRGVEDAFERLQSEHEHFMRISSSLQDGVMSLRLVPIDTIFKRFPRVVLDLSRQLRKDIQLEIHGGEVELDKGIAESLLDPLVHLVRNAVDHGMESPEERIDVGKSQTGRIRLAASTRGDKVVVEVADDGRGMDPDKIAASALKKGIVTKEELERMDARQKLYLIFRAGFSTADKVTDLSGRGVGMDVVRDMIERCKGSIDLESEPGVGSRISLFVPLTLAVVDLLLLRVSDHRVALPLYAVRETLRIPEQEIKVTGGKEVVLVRGDYIPVVSLQDVLGISAGREIISESDRSVRPMVVVEVMDEVLALTVTDFLQKIEVVLKTMGDLLSTVPFVSGATIMGDGRVVPVLDPVQILRAAQHARIATVADSSSETAGTGVTGEARKRILVAEDSDAMAKNMAAMLRREGYDVTVAVDGLDALKKIQAAPVAFDLLSTDINMPNMEGYELAKRLREDPKFQTLPIIAVTSKEDKVDRIRGFEAGFDEYLTKPVDAAAFLHVIERFLSRSGGRK